MKVRKRYVLAGLVLAGAVAAAALGVASSSGGGKRATKDKVTLQLKWVTQAQFAGYYAAKAKGYYAKQGLDVNLKVGGPNITPEVVVASGQAQFGIDWQGSLLSTRDKGGKIINIGQVYTRSGTTELTWKNTGLSSFCKLRRKNVGVWIGGNEFEQYAALRKCGIDPNNKGQVTIFAQPFDMQAFLNRQIDAASAMTYNELAQVLETKNPKTGKLYRLKELNVFKYEKLGTGMLQDAVFVRDSWIKDKKNQDIARRFLQASFQGWIYCRDHYRACVNIVLANGPTLGREADRGRRAAGQADHEGAHDLVPRRPREEGGREPEAAGARRVRQALEARRRPRDARGGVASTRPRREIRHVRSDQRRPSPDRRRRLRRRCLRRGRADLPDLGVARRARRPGRRRVREVRAAGLRRPAHPSRHALRRHRHDRRCRVGPAGGRGRRHDLPRRLRHPAEGRHVRRRARRVAGGGGGGGEGRPRAPP